MKKMILLTSLFIAVASYSADIHAEDLPSTVMIQYFNSQNLAGDTINLMQVTSSLKPNDSLSMELKISSFSENEIKSQLIIGSVICSLDFNSEWKQIVFNQKDTIKMVVYHLGNDTLFKISHRIYNSIDSTFIRVLPSNIAELKICSIDSIPYNDTVNVSNYGFLALAVGYDKYGNYRGQENVNWNLNSLVVENSKRIYFENTNGSGSGYLYATSIADSSIRDSIYIDMVSSSIILKQNVSKKNNLRVNKSNDLLGRTLINSSNQIIIINGRKTLKNTAKFKLEKL